MNWEEKRAPTACRGWALTGGLIAAGYSALQTGGTHQYGLLGEDDNLKAQVHAQGMQKGVDAGPLDGAPAVLGLREQGGGGEKCKVVRLMCVDVCACVSVDTVHMGVSSFSFHSILRRTVHSE